MVGLPLALHAALGVNCRHLCGQRTRVRRAHAVNPVGNAGV